MTLRLLRLGIITSFMFYSATTQAFTNMAYVEVNSNAFSNVACFYLDKTRKPLFDMASIFAANINGDNPNEPYIFFNHQVRHVLNETDAVKRLQQKGIKVLLTLLGNHDNAGWSCMTDEQAATRFADKLADTVLKYHLDGIDIDDEYSKCRPNDTSMIMIARALKANAKFKGKLLTKALFADSPYFNATYQGHRLADYLDLGFEMSYGYGGPDNRLKPYLNYGMSKNNLMLGISTHFGPGSAKRDVEETLRQSYAGVMIYDVKADSQYFLNAVAKAEYGEDIAILPQCISEHA